MRAVLLPRSEAHQQFVEVGIASHGLGAFERIEKELPMERILTLPRMLVLGALLLLLGLCAVACPAEAITMVAAERKPGEENLYREEKYAKVYEINMLRCIYCGLCESACPKEAIFLTKKIVDAEYTREAFIYGKDKLVEPVEKDKRIDVTKRQTPEVLRFKKLPNERHNI